MSIKFQQKYLFIFAIAIAIIAIIFFTTRNNDNQGKEGFMMEKTEIYQPANKKNTTHFKNSVMLGMKDIKEDYNRAFPLRQEVIELGKKQEILNKSKQDEEQKYLSQNVLIQVAQDKQERKEKFYKMLFIMFGIKNISDLHRVKFVCKDPEQFDYCQDVNELTIKINSTIENPSILQMELYHIGCNSPVIFKSAPTVDGKITDTRYIRPSLEIFNNLTGLNLDVTFYNELFFEYSINTNEEYFKIFNKEKSFERFKKFINYDTPDIEISMSTPSSDNLQDILTNFYKMKLPIKLDMVYKFRNRTDIPVIYDIEELAHQEITTTHGTEYNLFVSGKNLLIKTIKNPNTVLTQTTVNDYLGFELRFPYVCNQDGDVLEDISKLEKSKRITMREIKEKLNWKDNDNSFSFVQTQKF